jgi:hypothetical protein
MLLSESGSSAIRDFSALPGGLPARPIVFNEAGWRVSALLIPKRKMHLEYKMSSLKGHFYV